MIDIAEGRRLRKAALAAWHACIAPMVRGDVDSASNAQRAAEEASDAWQHWGNANIDALFAAAERAEAAERELTATRVELRRMLAGELPGGWTEELQVAIDARHEAERALAEAREDAARLDWLDARQPTFAVGRGPSGTWAVFGQNNIGGRGYSDVRAAIDAERGK